MMRVTVIPEELAIPRATEALDPEGLQTLATSLVQALARKKEAAA